jgi:hypothetical protein
MIQDAATSSRYRSNARRANIDKLTCSTSARCAARCRISSGTRNDTRGECVPAPVNDGRPPRAVVNAWVSASVIRGPPRSSYHLGVQIDITIVDSLGCDPVVLGIDHRILLLRMVHAMDD